MVTTIGITKEDIGNLFLNKRGDIVKLVEIRNNDSYPFIVQIINTRNSTGELTTLKTNLDTYSLTTKGTAWKNNSSDLDLYKRITKRTPLKEDLL